MDQSEIKYIVGAVTFCVIVTVVIGFLLRVCCGYCGNTKDDRNQSKSGQNHVANMDSIHPVVLTTHTRKYFLI